VKQRYSATTNSAEPTKELAASAASKEQGKRIMTQTETSDTVNDFLLGGGGPTAKFENIGDTHSGEILAVELRDQTDLATGDIKRYSDGNAMKQLVVTLQTSERDESIEDDAGVRKVYAKGQMLSALRKAVGRSGIHVGGKLKVKYAEDGIPSQKGFNPPKQYTVLYQAPAFDVDDVPFEPEPAKNSDWGDPPRTRTIVKKAPLGDRLKQGDVGAFWAQSRDAGFTREQVLDLAGLDIKTGSLAGLSEGELNILRVKLGITE